MQRFVARQSTTFPNGAVGWSPGGPFDCLGPYAKVQNCPIVQLRKVNGRSVHVDTGLRRTCYATGHADSFFSVPACCKVNGRRIAGFFTNDSGTWLEKDGSETFRLSSESHGVIFIACQPLDAEPAAWKPVREQYLFGSRAENGNRSALVCRVSSGPTEWQWFAERDGRTVVTGERSATLFRSERAAQRQAEGYLTTGAVSGVDYSTLPLAVTV